MGKGDKRLQRAALTERGNGFLFGGAEQGGQLERIAEEWVGKAQGAVFSAACRVICTEKGRRGPLIAALEASAIAAASSGDDVPQGSDGSQQPSISPKAEQKAAVQLLQRMLLGAPRSARRQLKTAFSAVTSTTALADQDASDWCHIGVQQMLAEGTAGLPRIAVLTRLFECPEAGIEALSELSAMATWLELLGVGLAQQSDRGPSLKATAITLKRFAATLANPPAEAERITAALVALVGHLPGVLHDAARPDMDDKETCNLAGLVMATCLTIGPANDGDIARLMHTRLLGGKPDCVDPDPSVCLPWYPAVEHPVADMITIGLVRGILSAASHQVLLHEVEGTDCLLVACFSEICRVVEANTTTPTINYFSRAALSFWIKAVLDAAKACPALLQATLHLPSIGSAATSEAHGTIIATTDRIVDRILQETWETWEHPVAEIRSMAKSNFEMVLSIFEHQQRACDTQTVGPDSSDHTHHLIEHLARSLTDMPWHVKGRYGPLCEVSRRLGASALIARFPSVLDDIVRCLGVNMLSRCAAKLYSVLLQSAHDEASRDGESERPIQVWQRLFWPSLDAALCADDELTCANCVTYLLPATMSAFSETAVVLISVYLRAISDPGALVVASAAEDDASLQTSRGATTRDKALRAVVAVGKTARASGVLPMDDLLENADSQRVPTLSTIPTSLIAAALSHADPLLQMDALALVSCDRRSTAEVSNTEIDLVLGFLADNGCVVLSATRQSLMSSLKDFFKRLRSSLQAAHTAAEDADRNLVAMDKAGLSLKKMAPHVKESERLDRARDTASDRFCRVYSIVEEHALLSLSPGTAYPRAVSAIQIWFSLADTMGTMSVLHGRPEATPTPHSTRNARTVLGAAMSSHSDVRWAASNLLARNFTSAIALVSAVDRDGTSAPTAGLAPPSPIETASSLLQTSWQMISGQNTKEAESGALLLAATFRHYVLTHRFVVRRSKDAALHQLSPLMCERGRSVHTEAGKHDESAPVSLDSLKQLLEATVASTRADIVGFSRTRTIVGIITAVCHLWPLLREAFEVDLAGWAAFVEAWVALLCDTGQWALELLSPKHGDEFCSSFADVDSTLESLSTHADAGDERTHPPLPGQDNAKEHILSMAWRTISSISEFFGLAFAHLPIGDEGGQSQEQGTPLRVAHNIMDWYCSVLLGVRHRGVIEACSTGLEKLCARLMTSSSKAVSSLPLEALDTALDFMASGTTVSVTRRGAGTPMIIKAVLTNSRDSGVMSSAMKKLLQTATIPAAIHRSDVDDLSDMAQVRAFNVLTAVISDGNTAEMVQPFLADALMAAITGFQSPEWAITNAATITYSTLVHRMLGMKRVRRDSSKVNSITTREFFARYPPLRHFLHERLSEAVVQSVSAPFLAYPILTLLSKLACGDVDASANRDTGLGALRHSLVKLIVTFVNNPILQLRELASMSLTPMFAVDELLPECLQWFRIVASPRSVDDASMNRNRSVVMKDQDALSANGLHGALLCAREFARRAVPHAVKAADGHRELPLLLEALSLCSWILMPTHNACAVLSVTYVAILHDLLSVNDKQGLVLAAVLPLVVLVADRVPLWSEHGIASTWYDESAIELVFVAVKAAPQDQTLTTRAWVLLEHEDSAVRRIAMLQYHGSVLSTGGGFSGAEAQQRMQKLCVDGMVSSLDAADTGLFCAYASVFEVASSDADPACTWWPFDTTMRIFDLLCSSGVEHPNIRVQEHSLRCIGWLVVHLGSTTAETSPSAARLGANTRYTTLVSKFSDFAEPTSLRLSCARSLGTACGVLLNESDFVSPTVRLLVHALCDDDNDVREPLASAVAIALGLPFPLQPYPTIRALCRWLEVHSERLGPAIVWSALMDSVAEWVHPAKVSLPNTALFIKEDDNLYVEPMWLAFLLGNSLENVSSAMPGAAATQLLDRNLSIARRLAQDLGAALKAIDDKSQGRLNLNTGVFNPTDRTDTTVIFVLVALTQLQSQVKCAILLRAAATSDDELPQWPGVDGGASDSLMHQIPELEQIFELGTKLIESGGLPLAGEMSLSLLHDAVAGPAQPDGHWELASSLIAMQLLVTARMGQVESRTDEPPLPEYHTRFPNPFSTGYPFVLKE